MVFDLKNLQDHSIKSDIRQTNSFSYWDSTGKETDPYVPIVYKSVYDTLPISLIAGYDILGIWQENKSYIITSYYLANSPPAPSPWPLIRIELWLLLPLTPLPKLIWPVPTPLQSIPALPRASCPCRCRTRTPFRTRSEHHHQPWIKYIAFQLL